MGPSLGNNMGLYQGAVLQPQGPQVRADISAEPPLVRAQGAIGCRGKGPTVKLLPAQGCCLFSLCHQTL
jgi:hypothetical protein